MIFISARNILRKLIVVCLLIGLSLPIFGLKTISNDSNSSNPEGIQNSFIDDASFIPVEYSGIKVISLKIVFVSLKFDQFVKRLKTYPKVLQVISETDSEHNIRSSTFLIIQSATST